MPAGLHFYDEVRRARLFIKSEEIEENLGLREEWQTSLSVESVKIWSRCL